MLRLDRDVHFLGLHARQDRVHDHVVGVRVDVQGHEMVVAGLPGGAAEALVEEPLHCLAEREEIAEGGAPNDSHGAPPGE